MKLFSAMKLNFENNELKGKIKRLEILIEATENRLDERNKEYRKLLGEKEEQRQRIEFLDNSLYKANKTIDSIVEVANSNGYGNNKNKLQKIIELAKFEESTSPIK